MIRHSWGKNNKCGCCGIVRVRKSWSRLMAITDHPPYNHYQRGTGWWYGMPSEADPNTVRSIGFTRPECKKL